MSRGGAYPGRRPPDSRQLRRQWALLRLLSSSARAFSVKELAEQLACSKSTVERDLATVEALFPLVEEPAGKQKRRYRLRRGAFELGGGPSFGVMQLVAVHAALAILRPLEGTPLYDDLKSVAQMIRGGLADRLNGELDRAARVFLPSPPAPGEVVLRADVLDDLVDAIVHRRECRLALGRPGEPIGRVQPLHLAHRDGLLYLVAREPARRGEPRALAAHRIEAVERTGRSFAARGGPGSIDLDVLLARAKEE